MPAAKGISFISLIYLLYVFAALKLKMRGKKKKLTAIFVMNYA